MRPEICTTQNRKTKYPRKKFVKSLMNKNPTTTFKGKNMPQCASNDGLIENEVTSGLDLLLFTSFCCYIFSQYVFDSSTRKLGSLIFHDGIFFSTSLILLFWKLFKQALIDHPVWWLRLHVVLLFLFFVICKISFPFRKEKK